MNAPARELAPPATLDDLLALPEAERRHELIEGSIYEKGAATGAHGNAQCALSSWTGPFGRRPGGRFPGGWWFGSEIEVYFDAKNTFRPDVAGWRRERLPAMPNETPIRIRPDWVCEILSSNRSNDLIKKKRVYHRHEVPHSWIIDPVEQSLSVHRWTPEGYLEVLSAERGETVRPEPFDALVLHVGILFGDDPDEEISSETGAEPES